RLNQAKRHALRRRQLRAVTAPQFEVAAHGGAGSVVAQATPVALAFVLLLEAVDVRVCALEHSDELRGAEDAGEHLGQGELALQDIVCLPAGDDLVDAKSSELAAARESRERGGASGGKWHAGRTQRKEPGLERCEGSEQHLHIVELQRTTP